MRIQIRYVAILLFCAASCVMAADQEVLFSIRAKDVGVTDFDLSVTEVRREPRKSYLVVPGFNKRSAAGSRWLMCVYTVLAMKRGFKYWSVVYPEGSSDTLVIGFPESQTEDISKTLGSEFGGPMVTPKQPASVDLMAERLCGFKR